jgi:serine/threonine-protein kinase PknG
VARLDAAGAALALPVPRVDPNDPNAGFLAALVATRPAEAIAALQSASVPSVELRLRELRARIELDSRTLANEALAALEADQPDDWRVVWYRGLVRLTAAGTTGEAVLAQAHLQAAAEAFDALYDAFPGEAAPKLALAVCAELLGNGADAAEFYKLVWAADHSYVSAAFGLARVRLATGDRAGAVQALESVPETSNHFTAARIAGIRARLRERSPQEPLGADLHAGSDQLGRLGLDDRRREELSVELLDAALGWVLAGQPAANQAAVAAQPAAQPAPGAGQLSVLGHPARERDLRFALERSYRVLARLADRPATRIEMVERANRTRPRTWV